MIICQFMGMVDGVYKYMQGGKGVEEEGEGVEEEEEKGKSNEQGRRHAT